MKLDHANTPEFFRIDHPQRMQLTHFPSHASVCHHDWEINSKQGQWEANLTAFLAKFPNAKLVVDYFTDEIRDNVDDFPHRGGGYKIGDDVMVFERDHGWCRDTVVTVHDALVSFESHPPTVLTLQSGNEVYWSGMDDAWVTNSSTAFYRRVRRPIDGDPTLTLEEKQTQELGYRAFGR